MDEMKLVFVYAADGGMVNTWIDIAHKIVSPTTVPVTFARSPTAS